MPSVEFMLGKTFRFGECLLWVGRKTPKGYGKQNVPDPSRKGGKREEYAHRLMWAMQRGPIPPGLQIDHLCMQKTCINVEHLEVVTARANILRGFGPTARNARKKTCLRGHPFDARQGKNRRYRDCATCEREYRTKQRLERLRATALRKRLCCSFCLDSQSVGG